MKIAAKPQQIYNAPKKAFCEFEDKITKKLQRKETINHTQFSCELHDIGESFVRQKQIDSFNNNGKRFAERLVSLGDNNLAGIVYSLLLRTNPKNSPIIEQIARNALLIAKRLHDPVHIMARANDLKEIYKITENGSKKHLKVLFEERRALNEICNDYEKVQKRYCSRKREMRPVGAYELKLAAIKFEIAEIIQKDNKKEAIEELKSALQILDKHGRGRLAEKIVELLSKLT